ncbi:Uma2 family endonuclease [Saccharopolyspora erythraea]|uniref:Uma2 family endonuclease n=1 Tax=Saccharopolyspora erythraea TaxID=1836 RepID=UPI001BA91A0D|nr:Uma2 family endonuclease [Saccharopolyspora erythraea]QUG99866.1 Uma2 family endonuclease [Saccharopolyspora erythraea]
MVYTPSGQQAPPLWANWEYLVGAWQGLNIPDGWRLELIEERLVPVSPPEYRHGQIVDVLRRHLAARSPRDAAVFRTVSVVIPSRRSLFIPDLLVAPESRAPSDAVSVEAEKTLLVAEISGKAESAGDRELKLWSYAHAGAPLYLLVDPWAKGGSVVRLYSEPHNAAYLRCSEVRFGEVLEVPEPFGFSLDTAEF